PEHGWIRTWLDRVFELPWGVRSEDNLDLQAVREVLDADHYGLDDVKDRIVEYMAVRKLRAERAAAGGESAVAGSASDGSESGSEPVAADEGVPAARPAPVASRRHDQQ